MVFCVSPSSGLESVLAVEAKTFSGKNGAVAPSIQDGASTLAICPGDAGAERLSSSRYAGTRWALNSRRDHGFTARSLSCQARKEAEATWLIHPFWHGPVAFAPRYIFHKCLFFQPAPMFTPTPWADMFGALACCRGQPVFPPIPMLRESRGRPGAKIPLEAKYDLFPGSHVPLGL